jgi:nucleoid-associated protein YgaU
MPISLKPVLRVEEVTHIVVKGDTLWDIANRYINDPFRYPELARLSKIRNPDLIYPGDRVHIRIIRHANGL